MDGYQLIDRLPTDAEYRALCHAVGWEALVNWPAVPRALQNSPFGAIAQHDGVTVAMGRVVGDAALYCYVQDVGVHPEHQHRGLGHRIVDRLLEQIEQQTSPPVFVGLFATEQAMQLYRQFGFQVHPGTGGLYVVTPHRRVSEG